jgi:signal transduction histidine kinase
VRNAARANRSELRGVLPLELKFGVRLDAEAPPEVNGMDERLKDIADAVAAVGRIDAVPILLQVVCEISGMRVAVVARIADTSWTACAVRDEIDFGVKPGGRLAIGGPLAFSTAPSCTPLMERAIVAPLHHTADAQHHCQIESFLAVPIMLADGRCFGALCALDPSPLTVPKPRIVLMLSRFATLIALQLDQLEQREREQRTLLDERAAGQLREQFIAILGHDLRNPLQAVYASSDSLIRKLRDPGLSSIASRIKTNARRMSLLIDDVLDFARGRLGGGIEVELTEVENINDGFTTVVQELQDALPGCKILSHIRVGRSVRCDLGRLQQVASNLLANALTHGRPHSPVKITARADENDLVLEVWNAGEPIPPENIGKMFEPFWRHSDSAGRNGLGLGLHICSQIARAHKGRISVTSTRETGTTFTVHLPLGPLRHTTPSLAVAAHGAEDCALPSAWNTSGPGSLATPTPLASCEHAL